VGVGFGKYIFIVRVPMMLKEPIFVVVWDFKDAKDVQDVINVAFPILALLYFSEILQIYIHDALETCARIHN